MNTQRTSKPRRVARSLVGTLAALLLLALLVAGNAAATSAGAGALNVPARCRPGQAQSIPPP